MKRRYRPGHAERKHRSRPDRRLCSAMMLFFFSAFLLISLKGEIAWQGLALSVIVPALIYVATMWLPRFSRRISCCCPSPIFCARWEC